MGTVIGGWLGYAAYVVSQHPTAKAWEQSWIAIISCAFTFTAVLIGMKLKLDYSAKLLGITFILGEASPTSIVGIGEASGSHDGFLHSMPC